MEERCRDIDEDGWHRFSVTTHEAIQCVTEKVGQQPPTCSLNKETGKGRGLRILTSKKQDRLGNPHQVETWKGYHDGNQTRTVQVNDTKVVVAGTNSL